MHVAVPFSFPGVPSLQGSVQRKERTIRPVPSAEERLSRWRYAVSGASLIKWAVFDIPVCAVSQLLPQAAESRILYNRFVSNGPLFMKIGQFLSTRKDVLSKSAVHALGALQDQAPGMHRMEAQDVQKVFWKETGVHLPEGAVKEQIGGGCISQVYRVELGRKSYAVKIIHPDTHKAVRAGLAVIRACASTVGLGRFAEQIQSMMEKQTDLRKEKESAEEFRKSFRMYRSVLEDASFLNRALSLFRRYEFVFPRPVVATQSLLVTEYWKGKPLRGEHAESLLFLFLRMVFKERHVHADLHPGNVSQVESSVPTLVVYDTGLTDTLSKQQRQNLVDLLKEVLLGHKEHALSLLIDRHPQNTHTTEQKKRFISDASRVWTSAEQRHVGWLNTCFSTYRAVQKHNVFLDECYTNLLMSVSYVHQTITSLKGKKQFSWTPMFYQCGLFSEYLSLLYRRWCQP
ncbi:aarF domain-containing kinase [Nematocida sp. AWRm77]|nr:aarF domain-containing kinase [Nematocida sp. AWRm77]